AVRHAAQLNSAQHHVDLKIRPLQDSDRFVGVARFQHAIAAVSKILGKAQADQRVILCQQDGVDGRSFFRDRIHGNAPSLCSGLAMCRLIQLAISSVRYGFMKNASNTEPSIVGAFPDASRSGVPGRCSRTYLATSMPSPFARMWRSVMTTSTLIVLRMSMASP